MEITENIQSAAPPPSSSSLSCCFYQLSEELKHDGIFLEFRLNPDTNSSSCHPSAVPPFISLSLSLASFGTEVVFYLNVHVNLHFSLEDDSLPLRNSNVHLSQLSSNERHRCEEGRQKEPEWTSRSRTSVSRALQPTMVFQEHLEHHRLLRR